MISGGARPPARPPAQEVTVGRWAAAAASAVGRRGRFVLSSQEVLMKEMPAQNNEIASGELNNPKRPPVWLRRWRHRGVMEASIDA